MMTKLIALGVLAFAIAADSMSAQTSKSTSLAGLSTQPSMNVFRRFSVDAAKMTGFYGDVLGLKALPPLRMPGGGSMILFQIGTGQVKLQATPAASEYASGPVREVSGLRVFTFFFPDEQALTARFAQHGYPAPQFQATPSGRRAMVQDPEKQWVELVVMSGASQSVYDSMEVGLTVTDLEKSRAFYRDFVGLDELPAVKDTLLGVMKYPFRHGTTTVNVWSFGPTPRANTRTAGIQYVISDVEAVDGKAKAQAVKIDTPLGNFSAGLRTIWLSDPDGITNYFAQIMRNPQSTGR
jgi:catechol-2,3-dioxygenase